MYSSPRHPQALVALALVAALGCGKNNLVPVEGVVTLDGRPIEGALVKFVPKESTKEQTGHEATAMTNESGKFTLGTLKDGDGAWRGVYKVCVQKIVQAAAADNPKAKRLPEEATNIPGVQAAAVDRRQILAAMRNRKNVFPKKYMNPTTTPIEITVPTAGPVPIDVQSEPESKKGSG
jgi:hypothetical protein